MWADASRAGLDRNHLGCPSELTDADWRLIEPLIPAARREGNTRTVEMRRGLHASLYRVSTGCQWRCLRKDLLRKDLPPKSTVLHFFEIWNFDRTLLAIHEALVVLCREQARPRANPCHHRQPKRQRR